MLKNSKQGITLITLVVTMIVMIILASIFIATSLRALNESRDTEIQNEINVIEQAISNRFLSYVNTNGKVTLPGKSPIWATYEECVEVICQTIDFSNMSSEDALAKRNRISGEIERDYDSYVKMVSTDDAALLGIEQFSKDDTFVVDYYTSKVYGPIE